MKFIYPYIYTTARDLVCEETSFDNEKGVTYQEAGGEHAIWAARIPFLPAMMSDDFTRLGVKRTAFIQLRQFRFIYDLVRSRENRSTFELRFISTPNPMSGQPNLIDIVFLGKVFSKRQRGGQPLAERLYEKFISNFPLEDPFGYPIEPVTTEADFMQYYQPMPFSDFEPANLIEIRKYEDMPIRSTAPMGRIERKGDYIAHPFVPSEDFNPMGRFFVALAAQPQKCYAGISIRPTRMWDQEIYNVSFMIGQFNKTQHEDDDITEEYIRTRSAIGKYVYNKMMMAREQLLMVRVYLVGENEPPRGLSEALGSEMMGNADNAYPTMWTAATPSGDSEKESALRNLKFLEQDMWGQTMAPPPLKRLRYLATAEEAYGAFRLPVPPESGYMPGVLVRNEPFVAPADELELREQARANKDDAQLESRQYASQKKISLGTIYHRGKASSGEFRINVRDLTRHALIAGSTGSGKSTTIKHILSQLWIQHKIPFMVLYPLDKQDYRELMGFQALAKDLLVFTLGDPTSPFQFNPFEVPEGLLIKTHLSRIMRVFMAAFSLQEPLPMIYREALRQVYRAKGWDTLIGVGDPKRDYPIMSDFYVAIKEIAESLQYGREVKDNVRQASVIRIADLLENAGYILNVHKSMPLSTILNNPTIMEIGRVGSAQDTSLLMGFLLMCFAEEVERHPRQGDLPHITVVEEAHRLMAETSPGSTQGGDSRSAAGEDFANILAEVRGYGEGIIIAEQIPTLLVKGAIGNTYIKIMHWLEDSHSFELFGSIMNLNGTQREYARSLTPGFAIVRNPYGRPVHIKVPEFGDQPGFDAHAINDISDSFIHNLMVERRQKLGLQIVEPDNQDFALAANNGDKKEPWLTDAHTLSWMLSLPMQTCAFCKPVHTTAGCPHAQRVRNRLWTEIGLRKTFQEILEDALNEKTTPARWQKINAIYQNIAERMQGLDPEELRQITYCYLAHEIDTFMHERRDANDKDLRSTARLLLANFEKSAVGKGN